MNTAALIFLSVSVCVISYVTAGETASNLTCPEFKNIVIGSFFYAFSSNQASGQKYKAADFYIATKDSVDGLKIAEHDWKPLESKAFNLSRKTAFLIHGYRADHKKEWIRELKRKLLHSSDVNLFILDWSSASWNYVNAVQRTYFVAKDIVQFLEDAREKAANLIAPKVILWNNLYLIGHSLGAHISGQTGHLLRDKKGFFKVERITGLDPAQPCFIEADHNMKLDKNDADFVDVIHTQTGNGNGINGLGLQRRVGHIDFYVNGGVLQPECDRESFFYTTRIQKMICSHDLATTFYAESLNKSKSNNCKYFGHSWDGSYEDALNTLNKIEEKNNKCSPGCPEMGINAIKYKKNEGKYLVILPLKKPYCQFERNDKAILEKGLAELKVKITLYHGSSNTPEDLFDKWTV